MGLNVVRSAPREARTNPRRDCSVSFSGGCPAGTHESVPRTGHRTQSIGTHARECQTRTGSRESVRGPPVASPATRSAGSHVERSPSATRPPPGPKRNACCRIGQAGGSGRPCVAAGETPVAETARQRPRSGPIHVEGAACLADIETCVAPWPGGWPTGVETERAARRPPSRTGSSAPVSSSRPPPPPRAPRRALRSRRPGRRTRSPRPPTPWPGCHRRP